MTSPAELSARATSSIRRPASVNATIMGSRIPLSSLSDEHTSRSPLGHQDRPITGNQAQRRGPRYTFELDLINPRFHHILCLFWHEDLNEKPCSQGTTTTYPRRPEVGNVGIFRNLPSVNSPPQKAAFAQ